MNEWIIIPFSAAPYRCPIRFKNQWWSRESYHYAIPSSPNRINKINTNLAIKYAIPCNALVLAERFKVETDMVQHILEET